MRKGRRKWRKNGKRVKKKGSKKEAKKKEEKKVRTRSGGVRRVRILVPKRESLKAKHLLKASSGLRTPGHLTVSADFGAILGAFWSPFGALWAPFGVLFP